MQPLIAERVGRQTRLRGIELTNDNNKTRGLLGMLNLALSRPGEAFSFETPSVENTSFENKVGPGATAKTPENVRLLSNSEVQTLILQSLRQIPDFPERGVAVTVYGFRPWNAMLNFAPRSASHS
jgi:hypothetical protein